MLCGNVRLIVFLLFLPVSAGSAQAQMFYEPAQYQYTRAGQVYYYGGNDPNIFDRAARGAEFMRWPRTITQPLYGGNVHGFRRVNPRDFVYSDLQPVRNAADFGYSISDAHNESNARIALYFRKDDLFNAAMPTAGGINIPAQAQPAPPRAHVESATTSTTRPASIVIIVNPRKPNHALNTSPKG